LRRIVEIVRRLDSNAEVYMFGSVAKGRCSLSSGIDVLVIANVGPARVLAELWSSGIRDPFEVHVVTKELFEVYKNKGSKLVRVGKGR